MRALSTGLLLLALACATGKGNQTICEEYRGQRCVAGQDCELDKERGCEVCHCRPASSTGPDGNPTPAPPPR
jgi:hypothetical protein